MFSVFMFIHRFLRSVSRSLGNAITLLHLTKYQTKHGEKRQNFRSKTRRKRKMEETKQERVPHNSHAGAVQTEVGRRSALNV